MRHQLSTDEKDGGKKSRKQPGSFSRSRFFLEPLDSDCCLRPVSPADSPQTFRLSKGQGGVFFKAGDVCSQNSRKLTKSRICFREFPTENSKPRTRPQSSRVTILTNHDYRNGHFVPPLVGYRCTTSLSGRISHFWSGHFNPGLHGHK